jgi:hypothetical protein
MNNLQKLLQIQRSELISAFAKASIEGEGTPQEVSDRREKSLHRFLSTYFPFPYRVTKGNISDSYGKRSHSIDALVINPSHPHTANGDEQYSFIVAEGVDYAIELKPSLDSESEIHRALKQMQSVKVLKRQTDGILLGRSAWSEAQKDLALRVPSIIFAKNTYADPRYLVEKIVEYYVENSVPTSQQFDLICCLDGTIFVNSNENLHFNVGTNGFVFKDFGNDVLYYFFHFLCEIPQSTPSMKGNLLKHYLKQPPNGGWCTYHDLNSTLRPANSMQ